jgi:hypothetical protein
MTSLVKITKEPIYAEDDRIVFLLIFHWYPNSLKSPSKARKGSFAQEKELTSAKLRFQKPKID